MRYLLLLLLPLLCWACEEETAAPRDLSGDYAYFPLELDQPKFYRLDSIVLFNTTRGIVYDTATVEVRETLVERFIAADGRETYRGERYDRDWPDGDWRFVQTYTLSRDDQRAIRSEDNLEFTKLVFPIRERRNWDGNAAFDATRFFPVGGEILDIYRGWEYRYTALDETITLPTTDVTLDDVVTVTQSDQTDILIQYTLAYERYAPGIGLVERFLDARASQCRNCCNLDFARCDDTPWDERAEKGFIIRQVFLR